MAIPGTYEWYLVTPTPPGAGGGPAELPGGSIGRDIWLDVSTAAGADRYVTARGDWKLCDAEVALRQSLLRRLVTNPGEWKTKPGYGVGARMYVKARNTRAVRDELAGRISSQFLEDERVICVDQVVVDLSVAGVLRIRSTIEARIRAARPNPLIFAVAMS